MATGRNNQFLRSPRELSSLILGIGLLLVTAPSCRTAETKDQQTSKLAEGGAAPHYFYVSSSSIQGADLAGMAPPLNSQERTLAQSLRGWFGPLGFPGVIGPDGPLGSFGPLGKATWNVSEFFRSTQDLWLSKEPAAKLRAHSDSSLSVCAPGAKVLPQWTIDLGLLQFTIPILGSEDFRQCSGVMGKDGPLGALGPLGSNYYRFRTDYGSNGSGLMGHLYEGGMFAQLGAASHLGPLGALGPLGPVGGHLYRRDNDGNYLDRGQIVRKIAIPYDAQKLRTFDLYEMYTEQRAKAFARDDVNDTSFMVLGELQGGSSPESDSFEFVSADQQFVSILVVPEVFSWGTSFLFGNYRFRDFDIRLVQLSSHGDREIAVAKENMLNDFIQILVPAGAKFRVTVFTKFNLAFDAWGPFWQSAPKSYRLYVTGGSPEFVDSPVRGDFQVSYQPLK